MDAAEKVAKLREAVATIERVRSVVTETLGEEARVLGWQARWIEDRANSIERCAKPVAIGDTIEVRNGHGYRAVTIANVTPKMVMSATHGGREERHRRDGFDIHPDDRARLDACFPRRAK